MKALILVLSLAVATAAHAESFTVTVEGKGRPMILIPGLSSPASVWDGTAAHFRDRYEIHRLQLAGFAGAKAIDGAFLPTVRTELAAYIRAKKLDKPVIVGHSLGGFMAFWLASAEPELVGPVIAVDGLPALGAIMNATPEQAEGMARFMAGQTPEQFAFSTRMSLSSMITNKEELERIAADAVKSDPATVGRAMKEMLTTDLRADVAKITAPVLLIGSGEHTAAYEAQVANIKTKRVVMNKTAKHFIMLDAPAFFYATLEEFLQ
ncbi:MAG TPA: alpha/beta hydrolase [Thermoanaerobaculia bacterium]